MPERKTKTDLVLEALNELNSSQRKNDMILETLQEFKKESLKKFSLAADEVKNIRNDSLQISKDFIELRTELKFFTQDLLDNKEMISSIKDNCVNINSKSGKQLASLESRVDRLSKKAMTPPSIRVSADSLPGIIKGVSGLIGAMLLGAGGVAILAYKMGLVSF